MSMVFQVIDRSSNFCQDTSSWVIIELEDDWQVCKPVVEL
jgi:hypothetical protein